MKKKSIVIIFISMFFVIFTLYFWSDPVKQHQIFVEKIIQNAQVFSDKGTSKAYSEAITELHKIQFTSPYYNKAENLIKDFEIKKKEAEEKEDIKKVKKKEIRKEYLNKAKGIIKKLVN